MMPFAKHDIRARVTFGVCLIGTLILAAGANADPAATPVPTGAVKVKPTVAAAKPATKAKPAAKPKPKAKPATAKAKPSKQTAKAAAQPPSAIVAPPEPAAPLPVAAAQSAAPVAAPTKVEVPSTSHVRVDVPAGLQAWLNADDRMRPWLAKAIAATDGCYANELASQPALSGTIAFTLTMHANARPSAAVSSLPGALQGMVLCVTTRLMGVKMPLFTGNEGDSYTVRVHFQP